MGTRSLTKVFNEFRTPIAVLYRQYDGYPTGHGLELAEKFGDFKVINGISMNTDHSKSANGMGCLFAQIIAYFKDSVGSFYLYPLGTHDVGEEYTYEIYLENESLHIRVIENHDDEFGGDKVIYNDLFSKFKEWIEKNGDG